MSHLLNGLCQNIKKLSGYNTPARNVIEYGTRAIKHETTVQIDK